MNAEQQKQIYESMDAIYAALPEAMRDECAMLWRTVGLGESGVTLVRWMKDHGYVPLRCAICHRYIHREFDAFDDSYFLHEGAGNIDIGHAATPE